MSRDKFNRMNKALVQWEQMSDEVELLRQEYDEAGWETLILHPGDVAPLPVKDNKDPAFRLTVPDSEIADLEEFVADENIEYEEYEVHRATADEVKLFLIILRSRSFERALFYPVYYDPAVDVQFVDDVRNSDGVRTTVTNLNKTKRFVFTHDNPGNFL